MRTTGATTEFDTGSRANHSAFERYVDNQRQ